MEPAYSEFSKLRLPADGAKVAYWTDQHEITDTTTQLAEQSFGFYILDVSSGDQIYSETNAEYENILSFAWAPSGSDLIALARDQKVEQYQTSTNQTTTLFEHEIKVKGLKWLPALED